MARPLVAREVSRSTPDIGGVREGAADAEGRLNPPELPALGRLGAVEGVRADELGRLKPPELPRRASASPAVTSTPATPTTTADVRGSAGVNAIIRANSGAANREICCSAMTVLA